MCCPDKAFREPADSAERNDSGLSSSHRQSQAFSQLRYKVGKETKVSSEDTQAALNPKGRGGGGGEGAECWQSWAYRTHSSGALCSR